MFNCLSRADYCRLSFLGWPCNMSLEWQTLQHECAFIFIYTFSMCKYSSGAHCRHLSSLAAPGFILANMIWRFCVWCGVACDQRWAHCSRCGIRLHTEIIDDDTEDDAESSASTGSQARWRWEHWRRRPSAECRRRRPAAAQREWPVGRRQARWRWEHWRRRGGPRFETQQG